MLPQFISSHNNESVKFVVCRLFERTEMWYEKFNYTQIYIIFADDPGLSSTSQYIPAIISFKMYE